MDRHEFGLNNICIVYTSNLICLSYAQHCHLLRLYFKYLPTFDAMAICTTVCPGSSDPFYVVTCYIKWVTTSRTYSNNDMCRER